MVLYDKLAEATTSTSCATQGCVGLVMNNSWASFYIRIWEERSVEIEDLFAFVTKHLDCCFL
jgi:hypothetical protein